MATKIRVSLARRNASKREKLGTGFVVMSAMVILWIEGTSGALQPNLTSVETWGETQIRVTWQPFDHVDSDKPHFYELYIDDYLEYFGNDVIYIARRLTPDTMYHFKLRSCIQDTQVCSLFSKTMSGTTATSRKRGFTRSFIQWSILYLIISLIAALVGAKITKRLWRSFLYRYDYGSETNVQLPKFAATTGTVEEDLMSSLCLKTVAKPTATAEYGKPDSPAKNLEAKNLSKVERKSDQDSFQDKKVSDGVEVKDEVKKVACSLEMPAATCELLSTVDKDNSVSDKQLRGNKQRTCNDDFSSVGNIENGTDDHSMVDKNNELSSTQQSKQPQTEKKKVPTLNCKSKPKNIELLTIQRAHTSPKLRLSRDSNTKAKNKGHKRALSFDSNIYNGKKTGPSKDTKTTRSDVSSLNTNAIVNVKPSSDLVIVVDNSNIFIGAQERASLLHPNERKRNIRVKIQQLVKVFQRGRVVSRAFVQGSSPPMTEQVWEVYRRLGYCVDVEDRRGKDEQRVDEGLHLHIYKALFELSAHTLVIASGDGNKGKSECATSLPGCAEAAIEKGWKVEIHSWQHSTSLEWVKLSKKYPDLLTINYLDRFIDQITFADGKYGRKCQPFSADFLQQFREI